MADIRRLPRPVPARAWLDEVLGGADPTVEDLQRLIDEDPMENEYIDFKDPRWLDSTKDERKHERPGKPATRSRKLRKWMAGFANSSGGLLVIGVSEPKKHPVTGELLEPRELRPFPPSRVGAKDSERAMEILSRDLAELVPGAHPAPRIRKIDIEDELIVIVGIDSAVSVVPCRERHDSLVYYFRLHDSTVAAPAALVADLLTGRKQRPDIAFELQPGGLAWSYRDECWAGHLNYWITNNSLVWMDQVEVGIVYYQRGESEGSRLAPLLARHVKVLELRTSGVIVQPLCA